MTGQHVVANHRNMAKMLTTFEGALYVKQGHCYNWLTCKVISLSATTNDWQRGSNVVSTD